MFEKNFHLDWVADIWNIILEKLFLGGAPTSVTLHISVTIHHMIVICYTQV